MGEIKHRDAFVTFPSGAVAERPREALAAAAGPGLSPG